MKPDGTWLAGLAARFHIACGWLAYRFGCRRAAQAQFERALRWRGSFVANVGLARIAFDIGEYADWRRKLEVARRLDPDRFSRLRHPLELFEPRLAGTSFDRPGSEESDFDSTGDRATWRSLRPTNSRPPTRPESIEGGLDALLPGLDARAEAADQPRKPERTPDAAQTRDDCVSVTERDRFAQLGPIAPTELRHCNLDELLRRLSG